MLPLSETDVRYHLLQLFDRTTGQAVTWCGIKGEILPGGGLLNAKKTAVLNIARTMAMTDCIHCRGNKRANPDEYRRKT